ncbi:hypothetical protein Apa02nite_008070 [Actinoplanes palleronii]|uniref:Uncharacterized protein n=1 Tax=Actinoplanes palleronii TaxID=113570 RepID=A0ABQ4B203_9ACTN|nr:hypothetical protein Apa02nite_008070 [Actinoplanes palleronii]
MVNVRCTRYPGADVEELIDAPLGQIPHGPAQEQPVPPWRNPAVRVRPQTRLGSLAVGREVVLAAEDPADRPQSKRESRMAFSAPVNIRTADVGGPGQRWSPTPVADWAVPTVAKRPHLYSRRAGNPGRRVLANGNGA